MHDWLEFRTSEAGYHRYEVSAYARPGRECRHNLNYWTFGDYLGVGAGAHSKISFPASRCSPGSISPTGLVSGARSRGEFVAESHEVARDQIAVRIHAERVEPDRRRARATRFERTGVPLSTVESELNRAEQRGLLVRDHRTMRPTPFGLRFLTDLQTLF